MRRWFWMSALDPNPHCPPWHATDWRKLYRNCPPRRSTAHPRRGASIGRSRGSDRPAAGVARQDAAGDGPDQPPASGPLGPGRGNSRKLAYLDGGRLGEVDRSCGRHDASSADAHLQDLGQPFGTVRDRSLHHYADAHGPLRLRRLHAFGRRRRGRESSIRATFVATAANLRSSIGSWPRPLRTSMCS